MLFHFPNFPILVFKEGLADCCGWLIRLCFVSGNATLPMDWQNDLNWIKICIDWLESQYFHINLSMKTGLPSGGRLNSCEDTPVVDYKESGIIDTDSGKSKNPTFQQILCSHLKLGCHREDRDLRLLHFPLEPGLESWEKISELTAWQELEIVLLYQELGLPDFSQLQPSFS